MQHLPSKETQGNLQVKSHKVPSFSSKVTFIKFILKKTKHVLKHWRLTKIKQTLRRYTHSPLHSFTTYLFQSRVQSGWSLSQRLKVCGRHPIWTHHFSTTGPLTHPHTLRQRQLRHTHHLMCTPLGCGEKQEFLEETHADMKEGANSTRIFWGLIIVLTKQQNEVEYNDIIQRPAVVNFENFC